MSLPLILVILQLFSASSAAAAGGWSAWSPRSEIYSATVGNSSPALLQLKNRETLLAYFQRDEFVVKYKISNDGSDWSAAERSIPDPGSSLELDPTLAQLDDGQGPARGTVIAAYSAWTDRGVIRIARSSELQSWSSPQTRPACRPAPTPGPPT